MKIGVKPGAHFGLRYCRLRTTLFGLQVGVQKGGSLPKIGIRPAIDGRRKGVRESLENQTMEMAKTAAKFLDEHLRHPNGLPVECVISDTWEEVLRKPSPSERRSLSANRAAEPQVVIDSIERNLDKPVSRTAPTLLSRLASPGIAFPCECRRFAGDRKSPFQ